MKYKIQTCDISGRRYKEWYLTEQEKKQVHELLMETNATEDHINTFIDWLDNNCSRFKDFADKDNPNVTDVKRRRRELLRAIDKVTEIIKRPLQFAEDKGIAYGEAKIEYKNIEHEIKHHYFDACKHFIEIRKLSKRLDEIEKIYRQPKSRTKELVFVVAKDFQYWLKQSPVQTKDGIFFSLIRMVYQFLGLGNDADEYGENIHPDKAIVAALKRLQKHRGI